LIVGQNTFVQDEVPVPVMKIDPNLEAAQVGRLHAFRATRDAGKYATAMQVLENAARGTENVLPYIVDAVKVGATVGEIAQTFRDVFGEHVESVVL
jgi:methylmalonyl-CoA mutase N-terminal domain/subunit